ncbi:MAG: VWA domain-containing protein [Bryobacterales bacterium]|nr:VWA domain-containing protein [Bryobacterales bacterium]
MKTQLRFLSRRVLLRSCAWFILLTHSPASDAQFRNVDEPFRPEQAAREEAAPTFRSEVRLVPLLATVKDANGALIGDLKKDEFQIFDNGVQQEVAVFETRTEQPLSVSILVDTSLTTGIKLSEERRSVAFFLETLIADGNSQDAAALYTFNDQVTLVQSFTRDLPRLRRGLRRLIAGGGTSLYDALYLAANATGERDGRHVVIPVTDGGDTTSHLSIETAMKRLQEADAVVYPILVVPIQANAGRNIGGENALHIIASRTGGKVYAATLGKELDAVFAEILRDLRTQYLIGFYPRGAPPSKDGFHRLELRTTRDGLLVQTRSGYYGEAQPE